MTEAHSAVISSQTVACFFFFIFHCCYLYLLLPMYFFFFKLVRATIFIFVLELAVHTFLATNLSKRRGEGGIRLSTVYMSWVC